MIRILLFVALALGASAGAVGFLVAASGVIPIEASSGHFAITEWFLQFSKRRSVATHTLGVKLPKLEDPVLILKGAGHYETGCRPCHGAPDLHAPRVPRAMLPPPPHLPDQVVKWQPKELFYIVKHGIKFTGMPAWPSQQRDDEVHAMVAFLVKLPGMDAAAYRQLVHGEAQARSLGAAAPVGELPASSAPARLVVLSCARCHGVDGMGRENAAFPRLAGQRALYLEQALSAYARDDRRSGIMQPVAAGLRDGELAAVARYFAELPGVTRGASADPELIARGRSISTRGIPEQRVPSCADCHGPEPEEKNAAYPRLAGQYADYLVLQLELLQRGQRGGGKSVHLMHRVVAGLDAEQIRAVAAYYASLKWTADGS